MADAQPNLVVCNVQTESKSNETDSSSVSIASDVTAVINPGATAGPTDAGRYVHVAPVTTNTHLLHRLCRRNTEVPDAATTVKVSVQKSSDAVATAVATTPAAVGPRPMQGCANNRTTSGACKPFLHQISDVCTLRRKYILEKVASPFHIPLRAGLMSYYSHLQVSFWTLI